MPQPFVMWRALSCVSLMTLWGRQGWLSGKMSTEDSKHVSFCKDKCAVINSFVSVLLEPSRVDTWKKKRPLFMGQSDRTGPKPRDLLQDPKLFQLTWHLWHAHTTTGSVPGFGPKDGAYYFSPVCHVFFLIPILLPTFPLGKWSAKTFSLLWCGC